MPTERRAPRNGHGPSAWASRIRFFAVGWHLRSGDHGARAQMITLCSHVHAWLAYERLSGGRKTQDMAERRPTSMRRGRTASRPGERKAPRLWMEIAHQGHWRARGERPVDGERTRRGREGRTAVPAHSNPVSPRFAGASSSYRRRVPPDYADQASQWVTRRPRGGTGVGVRSVRGDPYHRGGHSWRPGTGIGSTAPAADSTETPATAAGCAIGRVARGRRSPLRPPGGSRVTRSPTRHRPWPRSPATAGPERPGFAPAPRGRGTSLHP